MIQNATVVTPHFDNIRAFKSHSELSTRLAAPKKETEAENGKPLHVPRDVYWHVEFFHKW